MITKLTEDEAVWIEKYALSQGPGRKLLHLRENQKLHNKGGEISQICLVLKGRIKALAISPGGKVAVHEIVGRYGWLGGEAVDGVRVHSHTAIATSDTEVLAFERTIFQQMLYEQPILNRMFMRGIANHLHARGVALDEQRFNHAPVRFANALMGLFNDRDIDVVDIKTTQTKLAEMIGATRQTVNTMMQTKFSAIITRQGPGSPYRVYREPLEKFLANEDE